jgi:hypothetical protein
MDLIDTIITIILIAILLLDRRIRKIENQQKIIVKELTYRGWSIKSK